MAPDILRALIYGNPKIGIGAHNLKGPKTAVLGPVAVDAIFR